MCYLRYKKTKDKQIWESPRHGDINGVRNAVES